MDLRVSHQMQKKKLFDTVFRELVEESVLVNMFCKNSEDAWVFVEEY
jgi:hypothetical protein